jgi:high-affinity iron transporter
MTILNRFLIVALAASSLARPASAQEHPARRVANIVSVAVEEYSKAVDEQGKLISAQEYSETTDFLVDAGRAADRLSGSSAPSAKALLDTITAAVAAKRPPGSVDSLQKRLAKTLGSEANLEMPRTALDLAEGKRIFDQSCASCHGASGRGDGPAGMALTPKPPPIGTAEHMKGVTPAMTYRVLSVGIAGTPMAGYAGPLTPEQRWNVVAYVTSLRTTRSQLMEGEGLFTQRCASCHGVAGAGDGALARSLTRLPPEIGTVAWQIEHSDEQLAKVVHDGIAGTSMPPSRELSDSQVTSVVAYLRTLPMKDRSNGSFASDSGNAQSVPRTVVALLEQSLSAAKSGRPSDAADRASDAYMAFEPIESPARAKNPGLVASMERIFTDFRGAIRANDVRAAERFRDAIEAGLPEVVALTQPAGSGWEAFWQSFLIIVREGFEAILVVGAVVAFLIKTGHRERLRNIWIGVAYALLASAATAVVLKTILSAVPASSEIIEGLTLLVAVAVLFSVSYWLISKVEAAKWQQFIRGKVNAALEHGGGTALAFVAFLAVYREGAETALFYQALFNEGTGNGLPIALGLLVGFGALAVVFTLFYRFGVRIPLRPFFAITSVLLYYMAFVFMGKGIRELQEGNLMTLTVIPGFPHVEALGLFPSVETLLGQVLLLALFVFALAKTFWPRRAVTLPTIEPTPGKAEYDQRIEQLDERIKELEARLARMEVEPELQASESDKV